MGIFGKVSYNVEKITRIFMASEEYKLHILLLLQDVDPIREVQTCAMREHGLTSLVVCINVKDLS
jgi:hypothetical protein